MLNFGPKVNFFQGNIAILLIFRMHRFGAFDVLNLAKLSIRFSPKLYAQFWTLVCSRGRKWLRFGRQIEHRNGQISLTDQPG
jgi:hypothetical protein